MMNMREEGSAKLWVIFLGIFNKIQDNIKNEYTWV